jgi:TrmH family RNA methyltransferase
VLDATLESVHAAGLRTIGTSSHRGSAHTDADLTGRIALVVGNEARGLPDDADVDEWVTIRHRGRAESLNVAMAATVLCFEASRQRSSGDDVATANWLTP